MTGRVEVLLNDDAFFSKYIAWSTDVWIFWKHIPNENNNKQGWQSANGNKSYPYMWGLDRSDQKQSFQTASELLLGFANKGSVPLNSDTIKQITTSIQNLVPAKFAGNDNEKYGPLEEGQVYDLFCMLCHRK